MLRVLFAVLVLAGCRRPGLEQIETAPIRATPAALDFGRVYLGDSAQREVELTNPNAISLEVTLGAVGPFQVDAGVVEVVGGSSRRIPVGFRPLVAGPATGTLRVNAVEIPLIGEGLAVPDCGPDLPCLAMTFNRLTGACESIAAADGTTCTASYACFAAAQCSGGECRGTLVTCDDLDPCTLDVCGAGGCGQVEGLSSCPQPADPCLAPSCDRDAGCGFTPVLDGTPCGPRNCTTAQICLNGQCETRAVPQTQACVDVLAGVPAGRGTADGTGALARFTFPSALAYDPAGRLYVADGCAIRRISPTGSVVTLAGEAFDCRSADGFGLAARFEQPTELTFAQGALLVRDGCRIRRVSPLGLVTTWVGAAPCGHADGIGAAARLEAGLIAAEASGRVALLDLPADGGWRLRELSPQGEVVTIAGLGPLPVGVAPPLTRALVETSGGFLACTTDRIAHVARDGGLRLAADRNCFGLARTPAGVVSANTRTVFRLEADGGSTTLAGSGAAGAADGPALGASFGSIEDLAASPTGELAIADSANRSIRLLKAGVVSTLAGPSPDRGLVDGPGAQARLGEPRDLTVSPTGTAYFLGNRAVRVLDLAGNVSTVAGALGPRLPTGLALRGTHLLVLELGGDLRRVELPGGLTTTEAVLSQGSYYAVAARAPTQALLGGIEFRADGGATAGVFELQSDGGTGLTIPTPVSGPNRLYAIRIADDGQGGWLVAADCQVLRADATGTVSQVAGQLGDCVPRDGPIASARFSLLSDLTVTPTGEIYVTEVLGNSLRRVSAGTVSTVIELADHPVAIAAEPTGTVLVLVEDALLRVRP